jgi:hypothetical protein
MENENRSDGLGSSIFLYFEKHPKLGLAISLPIAVASAKTFYDYALIRSKVFAESAYMLTGAIVAIVSGCIFAHSAMALYRRWRKGRA